MTQEDRINSLASLGNHLKNLSVEEKKDLCSLAAAKNAWFTKENITLAIDGIEHYLDKEQLWNWARLYHQPRATKTVGVIMAGNIPMVGFHDLLSVLVAGHKAVIKMSSQDSVLPTFLIKALLRIDDRFEPYIETVEKLPPVDAVIATGSDNSSRYFKKYFGDKPNIIRQNRTSVAILTGKESEEELKMLGNDIFSYFGMGCRNVSKLYIPKGYDLAQLIPHFESHQDIGNHPKYFNNYEYNKAIYLVNRVDHLDNGFALFRETADLVSPLAVIYYQEYSSVAELEGFIAENAYKLQCIVTNESNFPGSVEFGQAQYPNLEDYADKVDTMAFLVGL
jgi:hypothetical protein